MHENDSCARSDALPKGGTLWARARDCLCVGAAYGYLTTLIVILGAMVGHEMVKPPAGRPPARDVVAALAHWDGVWYTGIVERGYSYHPDRQSSVAFFPAYPLLGRAVAALTGVRTDLALMVVSQVCFVAACVIAAAYVRRRFASTGRADELRTWVLLAMGLLPAGFFLRMAYSESLFLLLTVLVLYAIERRWPPLAVALLIGLATATRPVGVAMLVPLTIYLWSESATRGP